MLWPLIASPPTAVFHWAGLYCSHSPFLASTPILNRPTCEPNSALSSSDSHKEPSTWPQMCAEGEGLGQKWGCGAGVWPLTCEACPCLLTLPCPMPADDDDKDDDGFLIGPPNLGGSERTQFMMGNPGHRVSGWYRAKRSVLPRTSSMQGVAFWMLYNPLLWMEWTCSRTSGVYTVIPQWESAINSGWRHHTDFYYHRVC